MLEIVDRPIDVAEVRAAVADPTCGAVLVFEGVVRDRHQGREVTRLSYEAWSEAARDVLAEIAAEIEERWAPCRVAIVHRIGDVPAGRTTVVIAVATPHREACYLANRYAIEQLKHRLPIWKREVTVDGSAWKANTPARGA